MIVRLSCERCRGDEESFFMSLKLNESIFSKFRFKWIFGETLNLRQKIYVMQVMQVNFWDRYIFLDLLKIGSVSIKVVIKLPHLTRSSLRTYFSLIFPPRLSNSFYVHPVDGVAVCLHFIEVPRATKKQK